MPFDFSPIQLLIVLAIVLLVFGAKRLPEIARNLGSSAREFKEGISGEAHRDADEPQASASSEQAPHLLPPADEAPPATDPVTQSSERSDKGTE